MADRIKYERKTVQAVRGTAGLVISKMEKEGWEFVDQTTGTVRTSLNFRRTRKPVPRTWVAAAAAGVVVAAIITVGAVLEGDEGTPSDKPTPTARDSKSAAPQATETPASTKGKQPMTWGNWQLVDKIEVSDDLYGYYSPSFYVKNTAKESDVGAFTVTFLDGKRVLGSAWCTTGSRGVPAGEVGFALCEGDDPFKKGWTEITIEDTYK